MLFVFLMVLTFARNRAAQGSKYQNRNTDVPAYRWPEGPSLDIGPMEYRSSKWIVGGPRKAGADCLLICFAHGGGSAQSLRGLIAALPETVDGVAVQLPGRGPRQSEALPTSLSEVVDGAVAAAARIIDRPYALFGHSVGALMAFEAARRFEARALEPPLALFVSSLAAPPLGEAWCSGGDIDWASLDDRSFFEALKTFGVIDAGAQTESVSDELRSMIVTPTRADFALARAHSVPDDAKVGCPIMAFGGDADTEVDRDGLLRWEPRSADGFQHHAFDGGHFYFAAQPQPLADQITKVVTDRIALRPPSMAFGPKGTIASHETLEKRFAEAVARHGTSPAVIDASGTWTFDALDAAVAQTARRLNDAGVRQGDLVALALPHGLELLIGFLATLRCGGCTFHVPASLPPGGIADLVGELAPKVLAVVDAERTNADDLRAAVRRVGCALITAKGWGKAEADADALSQVSRLEPDREAISFGGERSSRLSERKADDAAFGVLSSGTTGKPKAILVTHRAALLAADWRKRALPTAPNQREGINIFFLWEVLRPLIAGRCVYLIDDETIKDVQRLRSEIARSQLTRILMTPSLLQLLVSQTDATLGDDLRSLKTIILNGEVVSRDLLARVRAVLPDVEIVNDYSISECHDVTTTRLSPDKHGGEALILGSSQDSGCPMDGVRVYILDEAQQLTPYGVPGEVYVAGETLGPGYLNAPEDMAQRFVPDPLQPPGRLMFRTGDIGRLLPGGRLQLFGRSRFMVKLRGYSIVPAAVEAAVRDDADVGACAILTVEDPETGQPDHLVAFVTSAGDTPPAEYDLGGLRRRLRSRLAPEAIPARFVPVSALPVSPVTGKRDDAALRAMLVEGSDEGSRARPGEASGSAAGVDRPVQVVGEAAPSGTASSRYARAVSEAWAAVLGQPPERGVQNFFDCGGHSLKAGALALRLSQTLGQAVSVADVYAAPTFDELVAAVTRDDPAEAARLSPSRTSGAVRSRHRPPLNGAASERDIAVIGVACRFTGVTSPEALWEACLSGRETYAAGVGGVAAGLADVASFDPAFWGMSRREATLLDPQHRLFLECAWHALERSGHQPRDVDRNIGVYAGCYLPTYLVHHLDAVRRLDPRDPTGFHLAEAANDKDYLAQRVAFLMDLHGPAVSVQTSCSTGLVAICQAADALRSGACRMAIAGASSVMFPQTGLPAVEGHVISPSGRVRPFDREADGTVFSDGVAAVILRPLDAALADGDNVLAVIKGYAVNNDGRRKAGFSAPSAAGQEEVCRQALADAGVAAGRVGYIEAHGTGTRIGDPLEVTALRAVYGASDVAGDNTSGTVERCALGSVKGNIGHANIAAGLAGFIKAANVVATGRVPPVANFSALNEQIRLAGTRLYVPQEPVAWLQAAGGDIRRAAVSSLGIGGTNAHMILEAPPEPTDRATAERRHHGERDADRALTLRLSAQTDRALASLADQLADRLCDAAPPPLEDVAFTLAAGRETFSKAVSVVARTRDEAVEKLRAAASKLRERGAVGDALGDRGDVGRRQDEDAFMQIRRDGRADRGEPTDDLGDVPRRGRRVVLPVYPFEQVVCWPSVDEVTSGTALKRDADVRGRSGLRDGAAPLDVRAKTNGAAEALATPGVGQRGTSHPIDRNGLPFSKKTVPVQEMLPPDDRTFVLARRPLAMPPRQPFSGGQAPRLKVIVTSAVGHMSDGADGAGFAAALDAAISAQGGDVLLVPAPLAFLELQTGDGEAALEQAAEQFVRDLVSRCGGAGARVDLILPCVEGLLVGRSSGGDGGLTARLSQAGAVLAALARALDRLWPQRSGVLWLLGQATRTAADADVLHGAQNSDAGAESLSPPADRDLDACLAGFALVVGQELPGLTIRCGLISFEPGRRIAAVAGDVARLVSAPMPPDEWIVFLNRGRLEAETYSPFGLSAAHRQAGRARLLSDGTHLITGGTGRIGLALARYLAARDQSVLITTRQTIDRLPNAVRDAVREAGGRIKIVTVDLTACDDILRSLGRLKDEGQKLGTVFHCAGLADLKPVAGQSFQTVQAECLPKIDAINALADALSRFEEMGGQPPRDVVLFSSLAGELGGPGMAAYAAANRYLDRFAERANACSRLQAGRGHTRWLSLAFDDWAFTYSKEQTGAYARTRAHLSLPADEAIGSLVACLGDDEVSRVAIAATDPMARWQRWRRTTRDSEVRGAKLRVREQPRSEPDRVVPSPGGAVVDGLRRGGVGRTTPNGATVREPDPAGVNGGAQWQASSLQAPPPVSNGAALAPLQPVSPKERIETVICNAYRVALEAETISPDQDFYDLGGDSLLAVDVLAAIDPSLPHEARPTLSDILEFSSPGQLADVLARRCTAVVRAENSTADPAVDRN